MEESRLPSGYAFPWVQARAQRPFAQPGGRSKPLRGKMHVSFDRGSGGSSRLRASVQRAQHPLSQLLSCTLCGRLVPDPFSEHPQMLFPPSGTPAPTSYCSRQEHPCRAGFPSVGIPQLPSALRQGSARWLGVLLGTRAPLPIGVTAVPRTL